MNTCFQNISAQTEFITSYDFEVFDVSKTISTMQGLKPMLFGVTGLYILMTFIGQKIMKNRPPFQISSFMIWWNIFNAAFGLMATLRAAPETLYLLSKPNGVYDVVCKLDVHSYATSFWWLMFVLSKFVELGDTAFIILRKQPLSILHWWHHSTTLLVTWYSFEFYDPMWRTFILNTSVHFIMYSYYTLKALGYKVPRRFALVVTTLQITQMLTIIYFHLSSLYFQYQGMDCQRPPIFTHVQSVPVFIFVVLLFNFFYRSYLQPRKSKLN